MSFYHLYKLAGYSDDDITYLSLSELFQIIDTVDATRNDLKGVSTRANEKHSTRPKFSEDLKLYAKDRSEDNIKERWRGIKGLDGRI